MQGTLSAARDAIGDLVVSHHADPDADVIELIDAGDLQTAVHRLMRRHGAAVYRYCREALRDRVLADDVHQQVFIETFRDLPRFRRRSSVRFWLFTIARHRVLDAAKHRRRERVRIQRSTAAEVADVRPSLGESVDGARLHRALIASLDELGDDTRTALLLRYQQGFSFEQMAVICREKSGTLRARVVRALPVLRARIEARIGPHRAR